MDHVDIEVIRLDGQRETLRVARGANLRQSLLEAHISPYTSVTRSLNCGGRGLCATCGVWIRSDAPAPEHWHDRAAARWGYPRLSCQVRVEEAMTVELVDKMIWGPRQPSAQ